MNSILWANAPDQINGPLTVSYSDVQGGMTGIGNISGNPVFLSSTVDLMIVPGSPCIDAGTTNAPGNSDRHFPPCLGSAKNDMGAHGGPGASPRMTIQSWPQPRVRLFGGVPGYNYLIQGSTNLTNPGGWQTLQQVQIAHVGEVADFMEPATNSLPQRFYRLDLAP